MLNFPFKRLAFGAAMACAALALAACHSSDHHDNNAPPVTSQPNPNGTVDTFIAAVKAVIAGTSDTTEPGSVDGVTATAPENTEPESTS